MTYTCADYRNEMMLLRLKMERNRDDLSETEKADIDSKIRELETAMGLA